MSINSPTNIVLTAVDKTSAAFNSVRSSLAGVEAAADRVNTIAARLPVIGAAFAAAMGTASIGAGLKDIINAADELNDLSQRTGIARQELGAYKLLAEQSGASLASVAVGVKGLSAAMLQHGKDFAKLGIDTKDTNKAFRQLADVFSVMDDGMEKSALAVKLFGRSGMELIPMLNQGSKGMDEAAKKSERYAAAMAVLAPQADQLNDTLAELHISGQALWANMALVAVPALNSIATEMAVAARESGLLKAGLVGVGVVIKGIGSEFAEGWGNTFKGLSAEIHNFAAEIAELESKVTFGSTKQALIENALKNRAAASAIYRDLAKKYDPPEIDTSAAIEASESLRRESARKQAARKLGDKLKGTVFDGADGKDKVTEFEKLSKLAAEYGRELDAVALKGDKLTKSEKMLADAKESLTAKEFAQVRAMLEGNVAREQSLAISEAMRKSLDDQYQTQDKLVAGLGEQAASLEREAELYGLSKSAIEDKIIADLDEARVLAMKEGDSERTIANLEREIEARKRLRDAYSTIEVKDAAKKAAEDSAKAWEKFSDDIERSLTDALFRAFENGDDFGKAFVDTLKNTLKSTVLKVVVQGVLSPITGSIQSLLGGGGTAGGNGSDIASLSSSVSSLKNMWTNLGSISNGSYVAQQFGSLAKSEFGQTLGLSNAADIGADGKLVFELSETGASFDKIFSSATFKTAAAGIAGAVVGSYIAGDYKVIKGIAGSQVGAAIGSFFGPVGAFAGGVIGGVVDRAFGLGPKKVKDYGIQGSFSGSDFSGQQYTKWKQKGGWFRSGKSGTDRKPIDSELDAFLGNTFTALKIETAALAQTLGQGTAAIANYSQTIKLSFKGKNKDPKTVIEEMFKGMSDSMAKLALAGTNYGKEGERASDTLKRLASSFSNVNTWLKRLNQTLLQASLASGNAASQLLDLFGGVEKFSEAQSKYFDLYYTEGEKVASIQQALGETFASLGVAMPDTNKAFRQLVEGLNLNTDAGRTAYAALVQLAPTFAEAMAAMEATARATAEALLTAYTGRGLLVPALEKIELATVSAGEALTGTQNAIAAQWLDLSGGLLYFGETATGASLELDAAQLATLDLSEQMFELSQIAAGAVIDFAGLSAALAGVDTATFMATINGALDAVGKRLASVFDGIAAERVAVRNDAINLLNAGPMSVEQIRQQLYGIDVSGSGRAGLNAAGTRLNAADSVAQSARNALSGTDARIASALVARENEIALQAGASENLAYQNDRIGYINASGRRRRKYAAVLQDHMAAASAASAEITASAQRVADLESALSSLGALRGSQATTAAAAEAALVTAQQAARTAQLDYVKSMQQFAIDAGKSVNQLSRLREETLRWNDAQKQLAEGMKASAGNLRGTVESIRFSQLSDAQKFTTLDTQFGTAYALALSTQGDTLTGYADKLNGLLTPLVEAAGNALDGPDYAAYIATALARADTVAARLEALAPTDYTQQSLGLLSQIDSALAELEVSTLDANDAVVKAIDASKDLTAAGLRAVVAALTGQAVPAFAAGGYHSGGVRLVGEQGPELEVTGASRIYDAATTRRLMQSGQVGTGETALLAEMRAMRAELEAMRAETRATAQASAETARRFKRIEEGGITVRTESDEPLHTSAV